MVDPQRALRWPVLAVTIAVVAAGSGCDIHWGSSRGRAASSEPGAVGSGSWQPASQVTDAVDRAPGACTSGWTEMQGTAQVGAPCSSAADCQPVCCTCEDGAWLSATCDQGRCADVTTTCGRTELTPGSCPGPAAGETGIIATGETCGGFSYPDPTCDACFQEACCDVASVCGSDADCVALEQCLAACAGSNDASCETSCDDAYPASAATAAQLDDCVASQCSGVCE